MPVPPRILVPVLCLALAACDAGTEDASGQYTLDVTVEGLEGELQVQNNGTNTLRVSANGQHRFAGRLGNGQGYSVTVLIPPVGQVCSVMHGNGAAVADVVNVRVLCRPKRGLLNDTGIDWCADATLNNLSCPVTGLLRQDAEFGRDAQAKAGTLLKVGSGRAGFDFTKLRANGQPLLVQDADWNDSGSEVAGTRWSCVRDNYTGLVWEVKDNDAASLHYNVNTYSWYNTDSATNGGTSGTPDGGVCNLGDCDTQGFVAAVNEAGLCGFNDWRLPTPRESETLVDFGLIQPAIDTHFFANTSGNQSIVTTPHVFYWTSQPQASFTDMSLMMRMDVGATQSLNRNQKLHVRLVRSVP